MEGTESKPFFEVKRYNIANINTTSLKLDDKKKCFYVFCPENSKELEEGMLRSLFFDWFELPFEQNYPEDEEFLNLARNTEPSSKRKIYYTPITQQGQTAEKQQQEQTVEEQQQGPTAQMQQQKLISLMQPTGSGKEQTAEEQQQEQTAEELQQEQIVEEQQQE